MIEDKILTLENMKNMNIDQIVELYKSGYRIDDPQLKTLQPCPTGCVSESCKTVAIVLAIAATALAIIYSVASRK